MHAVLTGRQLGNYRLLAEIDRGGMGVVHRGVDLTTGATVAIKLLPTLANLDAGSVERFRREADAALRLTHPGIVPILTHGEADGICYLVMELVDGPSLARLLQTLAGRDPARLTGTLEEESSLADVTGSRARIGSGLGARYARSCAAIMADVAQAVGVAHEAHVVHRDIKPSNILLRPDGRPVLLDFGLARIESQAGLTLTGDAVGTPAYMAPEQARGDRDVDGRVDVYGIGATLYELLTLRAPFDGAHAGEIMRRILDEPPVPPRRYQPRLPVDLATIVSTCLRKDRNERYASAFALERDLRAFLDGRPIAARPPSRARRCSVWLQRHRSAAGIAMATVSTIAVLLGTVAVVSMQQRADAGEAAIERAAEHLGVGRVAEAMAAYAEAADLLGDRERIDAVRVAHVRLLVERSPMDPIAATAIASLPVERQAEMFAHRDERAGRGKLVLDVPGDARVQLRRVVHGRPQPEELVLGRTRELATGTYLVRIEQPGVAPRFTSVAIARDVETPLLSGSGSPPTTHGGGMVELIRDGRPFAIARHECSGADVARMLTATPDPGLRRVLGAHATTPADRPLHGLSAWQARALANAAGGVVPSSAEWTFAGDLGATGWRYPFGADPDRTRVGADPDRLATPLAVDAMSNGASPAGIGQLLGNVAEFVVGDDGTARLAGGHWQSDPHELSLTYRQPVPSTTEPCAGAGLRFARLLPQPDTEPASPPGEGVVRWIVARDGSVRVVARDPRAVVAPPGLVADGPITKVADGHELRCGPGTALRVVGFSKRLLVAAPNGTVEVELPHAAAVDAVDPSPVRRAIVDGAPRLTFAGGTSIHVRFRCNGGLASTVPSFADHAEDAVRACKADGTAAAVRVLDVTAVGDTVSVDVRVDRRLLQTDGSHVVVRDVPLVVTFRHGAPSKLVGITPATVLDGGVVDPGGYRHDGMKVAIAAVDGLAFERRADTDAVLQVRVSSHDANGDRFVDIRGLLAAEGDLDAARHEARLSAEFAVREDSRVLTGRRLDVVGPAAKAVQSVVTRHRLVRHGVRHARERWSLVQVGRRWLWIRAVSIGDDPQAARAAFERDEAWFDAVLSRIEIQ